jgi:ABC-type transporter Mla subunit MlaD
MPKQSTSKSGGSSKAGGSGKGGGSSKGGGSRKGGGSHKAGGSHKGNGSHKAGGSSKTDGSNKADSSSKSSDVTKSGSVVLNESGNSAGDALHKFSLLILDLERLIQKMGNSYKAATDPDYLDAITSLNATASQLNSWANDLHTKQIAGLTEKLKKPTEQLGEWLDKLAKIVATINTVDQIVEAGTQIAAIAAGIMKF